MGTEYTVIRVDREGPVAEVVLDNPDKLNAMAPKFFTEIRDVFIELDADPDVRAIVLWAEGRLFTAGLDLKAAAGLLGVGGDDNGSQFEANTALYKDILRLQDCFTAIECCSKPSVAAVHGHCIGGGVDLTTACDIRVCTEDATFSIMETKIAIVADVGTLQRITPIVGKGMAREMAFTGKRITADRALRSGLVNDVYPDKDSMLAGARATAQEIAANSPAVVQGVKRVLQYSEEHSTQEGLEYVAQWNSSFLHTQDLKEAITAFMEKRDPKYTGQ